VPCSRGPARRSSTAAAIRPTHAYGLCRQRAFCVATGAKCCLMRARRRRMHPRISGRPYFCRTYRDELPPVRPPPPPPPPPPSDPSSACTSRLRIDPTAPTSDRICRISAYRICRICPGLSLLDLTLCPGVGQGLRGRIDPCNPCREAARCRPAERREKKMRARVGMRLALEVRTSTSYDVPNVPSSLMRQG